jgi:hypothetical protein
MHGTFQQAPPTSHLFNPTATKTPVRLSLSGTGAGTRAGNAPPGQLLAGRVLKLQVTSDDDPFFLHTMEVSEEDFQALKHEQAILVDFGAFPAEVCVS